MWLYPHRRLVDSWLSGGVDYSGVGEGANHGGGDVVVEEYTNGAGLCCTVHCSTELFFNIS